MCYMLILHLYKSPHQLIQHQQLLQCFPAILFIRFITIISRKTCVQCHPSKMTIRSVSMTGLLSAYVYPFIVTGSSSSPGSGSTDKNTPCSDYSISQSGNTCQSLYHTCIRHIQMDCLSRYLLHHSLIRYPMNHIHSLRLFVHLCWSLLGGHRLCCKRICPILTFYL